MTLSLRTNSLTDNNTVAPADQKKPPPVTGPHARQGRRIAASLQGKRPRQVSAADPRPAKRLRQGPRSLPSQHRLPHGRGSRPRGWPARPRRPRSAAPIKDGAAAARLTGRSLRDPSRQPSAPSQPIRTAPSQPIAAAASKAAPGGGRPENTPRRHATLRPAYSLPRRHCGKQAPPQTPARMQGRGDLASLGPRGRGWPLQPPGRAEEDGAPRDSLCSSGPPPLLRHPPQRTAEPGARGRPTPCPG